MDEIKVTWNLLLSGLMFPLLIYMVNKLGKDAAARSADMKNQIAEVTACVNRIKVDMAGKLDREEHDNRCEEKLNDLWDRVHFHSHKGLKDEEGEVVITAGGRR